MNTLDKHFHRAQSRLKSNPLAALMRRLRGWSQPASPSFTGSYWDIPAVTRKRAICADLDNLDRLRDYTRRAKNSMREAA